MFIKKLFLAAASAMVFTGCAMMPAGGGASAEPAVAAAAERLRVAMIDPTPAARMAVAQVVGHQRAKGGRVDTKDSFIGDLVAGKSDFVSITITEQTIKVVGGDTAIVRHTLAADTLDSGKPGKVALKILGIWKKQGNDWKLLARQAVRI
jgi:ketosteroid isomerase-like protein